MFNKEGIAWIIFCTFVTIVRSQSWSAWKDCGSTPDCYRKRVKTCTKNGVNVTGVQCVAVLDPYEEVAGSLCDADCISNYSEGSILSQGQCEGVCYDSTFTQRHECSSNLSCVFLQRVRCYNKANCPGTWTIQTQSLCSASCGGGQQTLTSVCRNSTGSPSYNCNGTNRDINAVETTAQSCNTQACPSWSNWANGPCSSSCGRGVRSVTSSCFYQGVSSDSCEGPAVFVQIRVESCGLLCFLLWSEWSQWSECSTCVNQARTRHRVCSSCPDALPEIATGFCNISRECTATEPPPCIGSPECDQVSITNQPYFAAIIVVPIIIVIIITVGIMIYCKKQRNKLENNSQLDRTTVERNNNQNTALPGNAIANGSGYISNVGYSASRGSRVYEEIYDDTAPPSEHGYLEMNSNVRGETNEAEAYLTPNVFRAPPQRTNPGIASTTSTESGYVTPNDVHTRDT